MSLCALYIMYVMGMEEVIIRLNRMAIAGDHQCIEERQSKIDGDNSYIRQSMKDKEPLIQHLDS